MITVFRRGISSSSSSAQPLVLGSVGAFFSKLSGRPFAPPRSPYRTAAAADGGGSGRCDTYGIHLFRCQDAVGIVAKISECIASRGGNLHDVDVFVPENKRVFYSRCEFVFDHSRWPREVVENDFLQIAKFFNADISTVRVPKFDPKHKIAVLSSKQ